MNGTPKSSLTAYLVGIVGSFLIVAALVWFMYRYTRPAPLNQARAEERKKNLADLQNASADALNNYAWQDQGKGFVRLPISRAMELTIQEYQNPAVTRSNMAARADKAFEPPPKAPEKPNPYE